MHACGLRADGDVDGGKTILFQLELELFQPRRSPALLLIRMNAGGNQIDPGDTGTTQISRTHRF